MIINSFTLIDAFNQFWKVCEDGDRRSLTSAGLTYYYLCNVWNTCGRPISFRRQNTLICAELQISKPTLERHRNILKQAGLIDFFSKGKGDPNIGYKIEEVKFSDKWEVKKEKNITTPVTTPVTTDVVYKQSTEIYLLVNEEVKNFYYLNNLFSADAGLIMHWKNNGLPGEKFSDGVELWMIQNNGKKYQDFPEARKHFLFWIPNYQKELEKHQKKKHEGSSSVNQSKQSNGLGKKSGGFGILNNAINEVTGRGS